MTFSRDVPPTHTIKPIAPPPDSERPTMAQLKADIDSGRTGDKIGVFDPGMAMLGTCEEAAGTPSTPEQVATARRYETVERWKNGSRGTGAADDHPDMALYGFVGFIALVAVVIVGMFWAA